MIGPREIEMAVICVREQVAASCENLNQHSNQNLISLIARTNLSLMVENLLTHGGATQRQKNGFFDFKVRKRENEIQVLASQIIGCGTYKSVMRVCWLAGPSPFNNLTPGDSYAYAKLRDLQMYRRKYKKKLTDSTACISKDTQDVLLVLQRELLEEVSISQTLPEGAAVRMDVVYSYREKERPKGLAMKYYECGNLGRVCTKPSNVFSSYLEGMRYAYDVTKKLRMIHDKGYCHLDFRPNQILVCERQAGKIIITDFGTAALIGSTIDELSPSPAYAAPELLRCGGAKKVDPAWDAWSLGLCILEIMYGLERNRYLYSNVAREIWRKGLEARREDQYRSEWCRLRKCIVDSLALPGEIHDVMKRVISGLLDINPVTRCTVSQAEQTLFCFLFQHSGGIELIGN